MFFFKKHFIFDLEDCAAMWEQYRAEQINASWTCGGGFKLSGYSFPKNIP